MTKTGLGAFLCIAAVLASQAALADASYIVDKVTITGSKTVPVETLYAAIEEHKGSTVTQADIVADQDRILKVLGDASVGGGIKTSMASRGKHVEVTFAITDTGKQAPIVTKVAPKLHAELFDGNKSIPTDKLIAASGLSVGQDLSNEKIAAAQQGIVGAYKAAKLPMNVEVTGENRSVSPGQVDVIWHVAETKAKKKRNTEDEGQKLDQ